MLRRVDSLVEVVFPSYLFKTVTSGEIGLSAGAEGATAPETLRQTDRVARTASGKRRKRVLSRAASADGIILSGKATDGASRWFSGESALGTGEGPYGAGTRNRS